MVHAQPVERVSEPQLMCVLNLRQVGRQRVRALITLHRVPTVEISQSLEPAPTGGRNHSRNAGVARIAAEVPPAVHSRNAQCCETEIAKS